MNENFNPIFQITSRLLNLATSISETIAVIDVKNKNYDDLRLRKENRIKSIQSSLAIENNTLSIEQVTAILNGKIVLAPMKDIQEAKNAIRAYDLISQLDPYSIDDLCKAHGVMTEAVVSESGHFRSGGVGIIDQKAGLVLHTAPPANMVYELASNLLTWISETDLHPLIASSIFHYEFEFIHPFADGNGRMGRLWQTLLLSKWKMVFAWIPVESIIKKHQAEYYQAIRQSTAENNSAIFAEFMLSAIKEAVEEMATDYETDYETDYVSRLVHALGDKELSAAQLMTKLGLSGIPNFRKVYLNPALEKGVIERTIPDNPRHRNQKYRRKQYREPTKREI